jgi:hypothetical protein
MQKEAAQWTGRGAIELIAYHWMLDARQVHADLMRSAGSDLHFEQSQFLESLEHSILGARGSTARQLGRHPGPARWIAGNGRGDASAFRFHTAVHQREVSLLDGAAGELRRQVAVGGIRTRHQNDTTGKAIQTVDDARALIAGYAR